MDARAIEKLIYQESGLLGVSGISSDMRTLEASTDPDAKAAIDLFVYRIGRELGSLASALGGLDAIVFTAGIGEHSASVRERVCRDAAWLGIELDAAANASGGPRISTATSRTAAWVDPDQRRADDRAPHARPCCARRNPHDRRQPAAGAERDARRSSSASRTTQSIAYGCAKAFRELGADVAITYLNEKAKRFVEPLAQELAAPIFLPLDVSVPGQLESVFDAVDTQWGRLDILVHSIAFAPKEDLQGGLLQVLRGRLREGDGRVVPFVRAHGAPRGAAHEATAAP